MRKTTTTTQLLVLAGLTLGLSIVVLLAYIFIEDQAVTKFISFILGLIPVVLGFTYMSDRQDATDRNAAEANQRADIAARNTQFIASRVNGNLDKKFSEIHDKLDSLDPNIVKSEEESNAE